MSTWLLLAVLGCPPPDYVAPTGDTAVAASSDPSLRVLFPVSSTTEVYCPQFTVVVDVDHFTLSEENYGLSPTEGEGHWHLLEGADVLGATADEHLALADPLDDGDHNLVAMLVGNDHQEYLHEGAGVSWLVELTVEDGPGCLGDRGGDTDTGTEDSGTP